MTETTDPVDLPRYLRRWLVIAGYVLGAWATIEMSLMILGWGWSLGRSFRTPALTPIHRIAFILHVVSPIALLIGCWGLQQYRRWARAVLIAYAICWFVGTFGSHIVLFIQSFFIEDIYRNLDWRRQSAVAMSFFHRGIYESVYPVALILCLRRPEIRDDRPEVRGFAPILQQQS